MAFTTLYEWTFDVDPFQPGAWRGYYVDLSQYAGQDVYIAIRHYWSSGNSAICIDDICLEWVSLGVEETTQSVSVYPNPAKDNVEIEGINPATVQIYNALGQLVKTVEDTNEISVAGLPEGVYLLKVAEADGTNRICRIVVGR